MVLLFLSRPLVHRSGVPTGEEFIGPSLSLGLLRVKTILLLLFTQRKRSIEGTRREEHLLRNLCPFVCFVWKPFFFSSHKGNEVSKADEERNISFVNFVPWSKIRSFRVLHFHRNGGSLSPEYAPIGFFETLSAYFLILQSVQIANFFSYRIDLINQFQHNINIRISCIFEHCRLQFQYFSFLI